MMTDVTDNEPPTPPRGMDADEYRRFQEFQRFQDYQRFVEQQQQQANLPVPVEPNQPVAPQPHPQQHALEAQLDTMRKQLERIERVTNPPTWRKVLGNKWLHRALWLVVLVAIGVWGVPALIQHYFGNHNNAGGPGSLPLPKGESRELDASSNDTVHDVYMYIAQGYPKQACFYFSDAAANRFGRAFGQSNCEAAATKIKSMVTDAASYAEPNLKQLPVPLANQQQTTISSCSFDVSSGPRLGTFTMTRQLDNTWLITGYAAQQPCPTTSSVAPTS